MMDSLPKDCDWIMGCDFNLTKNREDKSNDCGLGINDFKKLTWGGLFNGFQLFDTFANQ